MALSRVVAVVISGFLEHMGSGNENQKPSERIFLVGEMDIGVEDHYPCGVNFGGLV